MIAHAMSIVRNELNRHLVENYGTGSSEPQVELGNVAEGLAATAGGNGLLRNLLYLSMVNLKEEKTLKNLPNRVRNDANLQVRYENPPVFLNLVVLVTATHTPYVNALTSLSRAIRFFQALNVFTQDTVAPDSIETSSVPLNPLDRLESFRLIFDLYSPTMEEVNHLWGTLGGKQYPFVLYTMRMLDLKFKALQKVGGVITEVVGDFYHRYPGTSAHE